MYTPFFLPFIFLSAGVIFYKLTGFVIPLYLLFVFFIISVLYRGLSGYIFLLSAVFLTGIYVSKDHKTEFFRKNGIFVNCDISSIPRYTVNRIYFRCKVVDSDEDYLKGKDINVTFNTEKPFLEDIFFRYRISFIGFVVSNNKGIYAYPSSEFFKVETKDSILSKIWNFKRFTILSFREKTDDKELYSLGLALIFGEKGFLDRETKSTFIDSGLTHLLAISGLHVAMLISIVFFIFSPLGKRSVHLISVLILSVYPLFTGLHIPVLRASVMGIMYILSRLRYVSVNSMNILFFVAFIVILISPDSLFSPSFQLSFIAVFGILVSIRYTNFDGKSRFWKIVYPAFMISIVAVLFTLPVVIYHFGKFSPVSVVSTPFSILFLYPYLFFSVINLFTFFSFEPFVLIMNQFGKLFIKTAEFFDSLDLFSTGYKPSVFLVCAYLTLLTIVMFMKMNIFKKAVIVISLVFAFLVASKTDIDGYRLYTFKGIKEPSFLLVTEDRICYVYWKKYIYKIDILMDRYACRKRYLFFRGTVYFDDFDDYISISETGSDIFLKKNKDGMLLNIKGNFFLIENKDAVYSFQ